MSKQQARTLIALGVAIILTQIVSTAVLLRGQERTRKVAEAAQVSSMDTLEMQKQAAAATSSASAEKTVSVDPWHAGVSNHWPVGDSNSVKVYTEGVGPRITAKSITITPAALSEVEIHTQIGSDWRSVHISTDAIRNAEQINNDIGRQNSDLQRENSDLQKQRQKFSQDVQAEQ